MWQVYMSTQLENKALYQPETRFSITLNGISVSTLPGGTLKEEVFFTILAVPGMTFSPSGQQDVNRQM